jgi:uncharacterized protein
MALITQYLTIHPLNRDYFLMVNSLSGAVDIIDNDDKSNIELLTHGCDPKDIDNQDLITTLRKRGYLFENAQEEFATLQKIKEISENLIDKSENEISFVICPTLACNLRCTYCFEPEESRRDTKVMTTAQVENIFQIIDQIITERKPCHSEISLFGGEPLLPSTYAINKEIFRLASLRKMSIDIQTNGTHISDYIDLIKEYQGIIDIALQITLDGVRDVHDRRRFRANKSGTFEKICEGIDALLEAGVHVYVRVNLDRGNIERLHEFIGFIVAKGWNKNENFYCDVAPVSDNHAKGAIPDFMPENEIVRRIGELFPDYSDDGNFFRLRLFRVLHHVNEVLKLNSKVDKILFRFHYCEANIMQFYVFAPDGYIYPCPESTGNQKCRIGSFDPHLEFYPEQIQKWQGRTVLRIPKCRKCKVALFCGGGCAMAAINANNNIDDPVCNNAEEVLAEYIQSIRQKIIAKYGSVTSSASDVF